MFLLALQKIIESNITYMLLTIITPLIHQILGRATIINKFTLVVQEYFQERVMAWLETVGKKLLGIKHYWLRYEFAPSRGQIHAHMLVICDNTDIMKNCQKMKGNRPKIAKFLASWLGDTLGMTASINRSFAKLEIKKETHPSTQRYGSIKEEDLEKDLALCQLSFQNHKCSKYCMRDRSQHKKRETLQERKRRKCRCGTGIEKNYGKCDTPGFILRDTPVITKDNRGFDRVDMPRNHKRIVQASSFICQGWRGNCDIQYLIYSSDGDDIDISEISRVTNYVVAYSCKGNETAIQEKKGAKAIILAAQDENGDSRDVTRLARRLLNEASKTRIISKQEATCQLARLDLYSCSEIVVTESLAGEQRLGTNKEAKKSLLVQYASRDKKLHHMNLSEFFEHINNNTSGYARKNIKRKIPLFTGARCEPVYPPTEGYARGVLLIYHPWVGRFTFDCDTKEYVQYFKDWIQDAIRCPKAVRLGYERAKRLHFSKEPTSDKADISYDSFACEPDEETKELVALVSTIFAKEDTTNEALILDFGLDYDWCIPSIDVSKDVTISACPAKVILMSILKIACPAKIIWMYNKSACPANITCVKKKIA
jgi:hypothetical protein